MINFDLICFDCDSTLSKIEGIDELAKKAGVGDAMAKLTDAAMNGEMSLDTVYEQRLSIIKPIQSDIDWLAECYIHEMVSGADEIVAHLIAHNISVHIVSGGLKAAILPLAKRLGIAESNVHAVDIYFDSQGHYTGYDRHSPLARNGGKADICRQLFLPGTQLAIIGDGKTDMEAKQAGAFAIGFGGVVDRPITRQLADIYFSEPSLLPILDWLKFFNLTR